MYSNSGRSLRCRNLLGTQSQFRRRERDPRHAHGGVIMVLRNVDLPDALPACGCRRPGPGPVVARCRLLLDNLDVDGGGPSGVENGIHHEPLLKRCASRVWLAISRWMRRIYSKLPIWWESWSKPEWWRCTARHSSCRETKSRDHADVETTMLRSPGRIWWRIRSSTRATYGR